jgi:hypothetical protein
MRGSSFDWLRVLRMSAELIKEPGDVLIAAITGYVKRALSPVKNDIARLESELETLRARLDDIEKGAEPR